MTTTTVPRDIAAEKNVLGAIVIQPERLQDVAAVLRPEDFFEPCYRTIYHAMVGLRADGLPIDAATLLSAVGEDVPDAATVIADVAQAVPHAAHAETYARTVRDKSTRRQLLGLADDLRQYATNGKDVSEAIADTICGLEDISRAASGRAKTEVLTMSDISPLATDWLWDSWIPRGTLSVLDGDPGLGKSTITIDIAARLTTGRPMPPYDGESGTYEPADVLLLSAEDDPRRTIRGRVEAAGADLSRVHYVGSMDGGTRPPELPRDIPAIQRIMVDLGVGLLVIDPLMAYLSGQTDSHKDADVRRVLHRLARMAEETEAAILLVRHLTKDHGRKAKYRGGGSIGIIGAARSALIVGEDPDDGDCCVLAVSKSNLARIPTSLRYGVRRTDASSRIEWFGHVELTADQIGQREPSRGPTKTERCGEMLLQLLAAGPRSSDEVTRLCKAADFGERTIKAARKAQGVRATKTGPNGEWMLSLNQEGA